MMRTRPLAGASFIRHGLGKPSLWATCLLFVAVQLGVWAAQAGEQPPADAAKLLSTFISEFVEITPGEGKFPAEFVMGSDKGPPAEQPAHKVRLTERFAIAKYEVPQNLYEAVMGSNPSKWKGPRNSAEMFTFADAESFCKKITLKLREAKLLTADEEIRLPSETEWEYCCRAGTTTEYSFGDLATGPNDKENKASLLDPYGWHTGNAAGNDPPVGALKPNPWGLYDMHGYLWEFVQDDWRPNYDGAAADGRVWRVPPPETKDAANPVQRVLRGGSWQDRHELLRSGYRKPVSEDWKNDGVGMRCVKSSVNGR